MEYDQQTDREHRQRQDLAHRHAAGEEADMRVRLPEHLRRDPGDRVSHQEYPAEEAGAFANGPAARQQEEDDEEDGPFEDGLVDLARMARQRPAVGKHESPGHVRDAAPEFAVDEVRQPPEEQADGRGAGDRVADAQRVEHVAAREDPDREEHPDQYAVERHAAVPYGESVERMHQVKARPG